VKRTIKIKNIGTTTNTHNGKVGKAPGNSDIIKVKVFIGEIYFRVLN